MNDMIMDLQNLLDRTPRRHQDENVKEMNSIVMEYEDILLQIEAINSYYEKNIAEYFNDVEEVKLLIKKSNDKKVSKKTKDTFFDEASTTLKNSIEKLMVLYGDGKKES